MLTLYTYYIKEHHHTSVGLIMVTLWIYIFRIFIVESCLNGIYISFEKDLLRLFHLYLSVYSEKVSEHRNSPWGTPANRKYILIFSLVRRMRLKFRATADVKCLTNMSRRSAGAFNQVMDINSIKFDIFEFIRIIHFPYLQL